MRYDLAGRTVVLTGAASGIGAALAGHLAAHGCRLVLVGRDRTMLELAAAPLGPAVSSLHGVDVTDRAAIAGLPAEIVGSGAVPHIDVLINNAGIAAMGRFDQLSLDEFDRVMAVNFGGVLAMTKAFLPHLGPDARIANISSLFGLIAPPGQLPYVTSKFAVRGFTEALRHELAGTGIKVTAIHPGGVRTAIARNAEIAGAIDPGRAQAATAAFGKLLRMEPDRAAALIVRAVEKGKPRLLIGGDAVFGDLLARLAPARYGHVLRPLMGGMREHVGSMVRGGQAS
ncbi:MAG TPA: SDR family NAD(P)-dependent oxidoreductase [Sphingopyxis sp.]|nr:SDR family NAD(P)-dependent oxidoreductase [Sphingopyxis sp.]